MGGRAELRQMIVVGAAAEVVMFAASLVIEGGKYSRKRVVATAEKVTVRRFVSPKFWRTDWNMLASLGVGVKVVTIPLWLIGFVLGSNVGFDGLTVSTYSTHEATRSTRPALGPSTLTVAST